MQTWIIPAMIIPAVLCLSATGIAMEVNIIGPWGPQPEMHPASIRKSPGELPFRSWQLQNDDDNVRKLITAARDYGINNIQLSHLQVMYAHQLLEDPQKIKRFNEYIDLAHQNGATVHIWTHEFGGIPKSITREYKWFDKPEVWELLDERYAKLFEVMPELDGVVLTFHETEIKVFDVESDLPLADRVAKLINHLHTTLKRLNKTLVVRTFAYEPEEVEGVSDAFSMIDPEIILMSKCVPHDWEVFYPHNLAIGRYADRKHIIEFDPGAEFYGKGHVPYLYPEYLHFRLEYARDRNAYGYVARVERQGNPSAVPGISEGSGLNELNLYAMSRYAADPAVSPEKVWREYMEKRVGKGAYVEPLIEALKLTDDVLNRCYFMLGTWYNNHSALPSKEYADSHIDFIQKWNDQYKPVVKRLLEPDARTVGEVFRESEESVVLARRALEQLELSRKAGLPDAQYKEYMDQLSKLLDTAKKWAEHRNAYIQQKAGGVEPTYDGPFPVGGPPRLDAKAGNATAEAPRMLSDLESPILLEGDATRAYRDPAVLYHDGVFHLFVTLVETDPDQRIYSYTVQSTSKDLKSWTEPRVITPKGQELNFSSPGNVIRFQNEWILCLQTYPRPGYRRGDQVTWADGSARIYIMRSRDLENWSEPELLYVKGADVPREKMGRMIDPYLLQDKDDPTKWWCFFKQNGVSYSWSRDLTNWTHKGRAPSGENVCVLVDNDEYVMIHSPANGMGIMRSRDLKTWSHDPGLITLGQKKWPWAETRLTAGVVLDLREQEGFGKYVMFFHAGGPGRAKTQDNVDANCSIGIAWSSDLKQWDWPGKDLAE